MPALAAVILAAGGSTRMGRPKQTLELRGQTLLQRIIGVAKIAGCSPIIVVTSSAAEGLIINGDDPSIHAVENSQWSNGMGTSIRAGFSAAIEAEPNLDRVVMLLCDQPLVTHGTILRLIDAQRKTAKPACIASFDDTIGPPVLVTKQFFPQMLGLADNHGAKAIWQRHPELVEKVPCPEAAIDIDTPAQYAAVLSRCD